MRRLATTVAVVAALVAPPAGADPAGKISDFVRVIEQGPGGVTLRVRIPREAVATILETDGMRRVTIEGLRAAVRPGAPELPVLVAGLVVPDDARLELSFATSAEVVLAGPPLGIVPGDAALEPGGAPWPEERVTVERARFRGLDVARLLVHPARYDATSHDVRLVLDFEIRLDFIGGSGFARSMEAIEERIGSRHLLNWGHGAAFRSPTGEEPSDGAPLPPVAPLMAGAANPAVKIRVDTEGLIRVTRADLVAAGFDPSGVDPRNLELSYRGTPLPCRVVGESDGGLDPGDAVEFFGIPGSGRYSEENVYWLEEQSGPGLRFPTRSAAPGSAPIVGSFPHTERFEESNAIYTFGKPAQEGDPHFFWVFFDGFSTTPPRVMTFTHGATLPGLNPAGPMATLRAFFAGRTDDLTADPDHRVRFSVNATEIGETSWNGQTFHTVGIPFDATLLGGGVNAFTFDLVPIAFPDIYYMDWFAIEYPRLTVAAGDRLIVQGENLGPARYAVSGFASAIDAVVLDVGQPFSPVQLSGAAISGSGPFTITFEDAVLPRNRYLVVGDGGRESPAGLELDAPSNLSDPANGADLVIVVPEGWESALAGLVAHRQGQGLRVVLASLTDVADEFAGGNVDDTAIRDFIAHAYATWQAPPLSAALLVGEPNLDALNYIGESPFYHFMPTHFTVTGAQGETMSDTWFGAVAGADLLPDVAIGRFSVRSAGEASDLAAKIIDYESNAVSGSTWSSNVLQVASNQTTFEAALASAAAQLPAHFTVDSQYRRLGANATSIVNGFNAGALLASFLGHGNITFWADNPGGPFFDDSEVAILSNAGRIPLVTALNCLNGLIGHPLTLDSLAEEFVNRPTTGALAMWSPSSLGFVTEYDALQTALYGTIFQDHVPQIGAAATSSLVETFLTAPTGIDLVKQMILLGDPAGWLATDSDADLILDVVELRDGSDPGDRDSDDDGWLDGAEVEPGADADGDGVVNALDPDADNDGLPDGLEAGVTAPDGDTDVSRGFFLADLDPSSTTDPLDPDTDGGGAPDGVEDTNADGQVGAGETDPGIGADDPVCSANVPPEIAATPAGALVLARSGSDLILSWGDASGSDSCLLYRVYTADDLDNASGKPGFRLLAVTGQPSYTHRGSLADPFDRRYLVVGASLTAGEGPWGHYEAGD